MLEKLEEKIEIIFSFHICHRFQRDDVFTIMSLCITEAVWSGLRAYEFVGAQITEAQLQTLILAAVTSMAIPHHTIRKVLKMEYSEVTI
jgi:hypothetical protein